MEKRRKPDTPERGKEAFFGDPPLLPEVGDVASAQELTGLIPTIPPEQNGTEVYRTLFSTSLPEAAGTDMD